MRRTLARLGLTVARRSRSAWLPPRPRRPRASGRPAFSIVVMDQMRPEYVDMFDMDNVRGLIEDGVNYEDAYLGHMGSETVITHNVLATGVLPKNMGWSDEVQRDVDNVLGEGARRVLRHLEPRARPVLRAPGRLGRPAARRLPPRDASRARSSSPSARRRPPPTPPAAPRRTSSSRSAGGTSTARAPATRTGGPTGVAVPGVPLRPDVRALLHRLEREPRLRHADGLSRRACTRRTGTGSSPGSTRRTSAATRGSRTPRSR